MAEAREQPFIENLRNLFNGCDKDKNGCLNRREFFELCAKIGLNGEAAHETFERLDTDKNGWITFAEFSAGFQQYKRNDPAAASASGASARPRSALAKKKAASPVGVMSLGVDEPTSNSMSHNSNNHNDQDYLVAMSCEEPMLMGAYDERDDDRLQMQYDHYNHNNHEHLSLDAPNPYLEALEHQHNGGVPSLGSAGGPSSFSQYGAANTTTSNMSASTSSFGHLSPATNGRPQFKSMQDLLSCVERLQSENQILSQKFSRDKREREHQISRLGEEYDSQLREVEQRASEKARELEAARRKLRELMQQEQRQLEGHRDSFASMSDMVRSTNLEGGEHQHGSASAGANLDSIVDVKHKLEDTYMENKQLRKSLLDTKTDVAMIWKEMEKLKRQYEQKLSSAYETNQKTRDECDHIKQQLAQVKDSHRRLQDHSDVITHYIEDKVEPVIKIATNQQGDLYDPGDPQHSLTGSLMLAASRSSSRRGSILSEYLKQPQDDDHTTMPEIITTSPTPTPSTDAPSTQRMQSMPAPDTQQVNEDTSTPREAPPLQPSKSLDAKTRATMRLRNIGKILFQSSKSDSLEAGKPPTTAAADQQGAKSAEPRLPPLPPPPPPAIAPQIPPREPRLEPADAGPIAATYDIILIGDSFVGKSSLATRITEGKYVKGIISTTSIDFKQKRCKLDGLNYEINIWDTAGQERFRSITASYFRKAKGIILMYDVTEKHTYLNVRNWMNTIANNAPETVAVLLLANKIDLRTEDNKFACIQTEDGLRLANEYGIIFVETSVKSGVNLESSVAQLIRLIIENNKTPEDEDTDKIRLDVKNRGYACMPKNC